MAKRFDSVDGCVAVSASVRDGGSEAIAAEGAMALALVCGDVIVMHAMGEF